MKPLGCGGTDARGGGRPLHYSYLLGLWLTACPFPSASVSLVLDTRKPFGSSLEIFKIFLQVAFLTVTEDRVYLNKVGKTWEKEYKPSFCFIWSHY